MSSFVGFEVELPDPGESPWIVEAYRIYVKAKRSLPGGTIELRAREIVFSDQGEINVDGGITSQEGLAGAVPTDPGSNGANGKDGDTGSLGGNITLVCEKLGGPIKLSAKGGTGGQGGNATDGIMGGRGQNGGEGIAGKMGLKGGDAGRGGKGGDGGRGGTINIFSQDSSQATFVLKDVSGGGAGSAGANGKPGDGGPPGADGWRPQTGHGPGSDRGGQRIKQLTAAFSWNEGPGPAGNAVPANTSGGSGTSGTFTVEQPSSAEPRLRSAMSDDCLQKLLQQAETYYYDREGELAMNTLQFVSSVSQPE